MEVGVHLFLLYFHLPSDTPLSLAGPGPCSLHGDGSRGISSLSKASLATAPYRLANRPLAEQWVMGVGQTIPAFEKCGW